MLIVLLAPARAQVSVAEAPAPDRWVAAGAAAHRILSALALEADLPSVSAAVALHGEVVWSTAIGRADLERGVPATPRTRYRIGSLSKALTAAAAVRLHERGLLDLDAPIGTILDSLPEHLRPITARQLLGHLGGVRHYADDESVLSHRSYASVGEALERFAGDPLLHPPGSAYDYSSYGYVLLSAVIEAAAGTPFLEHVREEVLPAFGMTGTVADHPDSVIVDRAAFYRESEVDGRLLNAPATDDSYKWAAGGYLSTAGDLARFASRLAGGAWVGPAATRAVFAPMTTDAGDTTGYAMGWRPREDPEGRPVAHHGGSSVGGRAFLLVYPETSLSVALLVNASRAPIFEQEAETIAHLFLDHPPTAGPIDGDSLAGTWRFATTRRGKPVEGTLHLTGSARHPGWIEWEGAAPVPIVLVDRHPDGHRLVGAGVHGLLNLRATFDADGFVGRWDWLGETTEITGRPSAP